MLKRITLINGEVIEGDLKHFHHNHPDDSKDRKERKNWHYYVDKNNKNIYHLRKEHIVSVTEIGAYKK